MYISLLHRTSSELLLNHLQLPQQQDVDRQTVFQFSY